MNYARGIIVGRLCADPEHRTTPSGVSCGTMRLAANHKRGEREEVLFMTVRTFGKTADLCAAHLARGSEVLVDGRLSQEEWEAKDGSGKRSQIVLVADTVQFGAMADPNTAGSRAETTQRPTNASDDEDYPF